jgi:hypothetical protein
MVSKKINKQVFYIICIGIVVLLALAATFLTQKKVKFFAPPSPSPQEEAPTILSGKPKVIEQTPYITQDFTVTYQPASQNSTDFFLVTVLKTPYKDIKKKAEAWFQEQGVDDLCTLDIKWWADRQVLSAEKLTEEDLSTTDCPVPPQLPGSTPES